MNFFAANYSICIFLFIFPYKENTIIARILRNRSVISDLFESAFEISCSSITRKLLKAIYIFSKLFKNKENLPHIDKRFLSSTEVSRAIDLPLLS